MADGEIKFTAAVYKVQTLVDGGVRVTLDLPETAIMQMAQLAECQRFGVVVEFTGEALKNNKDQHAIREGQKRKSQRTPAQEQSINGDT